MSRIDARQLAQDLLAHFGAPSVLVGEAVRERPVSKQVPSGCEAVALVRPASTEELARVVRFCTERGVAVVPRGGMTGLVGGSIAGPQEVALSLERMVGVESVDVASQTMVVRAGTPLQVVQEAADACGLSFPLDLGARGSATIGGNLATNAGGNKVLRYGMVRDMVLGLEVVLPSGEILSSMFGLLKNNTGLDVKQLFIGSEGTLGIITRAVLRLQPKSRHQRTALCAFQDFDSLLATLQAMRDSAGPALTSFEAMWNSYYTLVTQEGRLRPPLPRHYPYYALIECEYPGAANDGAAHFEAFDGVLHDCMERGLICDAVIAQSDAERQQIWTIRDEVHYIRTLSPIFVYDISIPVSCIDPYVERVRASVLARWADAAFICYGHVGDGNIHLAISCGHASDLHDVNLLVYQPLADYRGSISAEHGIGLMKKPYLPLTRNEVELKVMRAVKAALDPRNLMNPGKIL